MKNLSKLQFKGFEKLAAWSNGPLFKSKVGMISTNFSCHLTPIHACLSKPQLLLFSRHLSNIPLFSRSFLELTQLLPTHQIINYSLLHASYTLIWLPCWDILFVEWSQIQYGMTNWLGFLEEISIIRAILIFERMQTIPIYCFYSLCLASFLPDHWETSTSLKIVKLTSAVLPAHLYASFLFW